MSLVEGDPSESQVIAASFCLGWSEDVDDMVLSNMRATSQSAYEV